MKRKVFFYPLQIDVPLCICKNHVFVRNMFILILKRLENYKMKWIVLFVILYNGCSLAWEKIYLHKKQYLWCKSSLLPVVSFIHNALLMYNRNARVKYHYIWKGESISVNFWQVVVVSVDADILMYTGYLFSLVVVLNHIPIPNVELLLTVRKAWYDNDKNFKFNILYLGRLRKMKPVYIYQIVWKIFWWSIEVVWHR